MPNCPVCGTETDAEAKFCPECGASLATDDADTPQAVREMAAEYAQRVRENPDDTAARYDLALARMYERKWGPAIEQLEKVIELEPRFADAWGNLAVCLARVGRPDDARKAVDRALELNPDKKRFRKIRRQLDGRTH